MIEQHRDVFSDVTDRESCWIGVRYPNPLADHWILTPGCMAKPLWCKAKTADRTGHDWGGLVVSPVIVPDAFEEQSRLKALQVWRDVLNLGRLSPGFTMDEKGPEAGLLKIGGRKVHADYDLMALLLADRNGRKLTTSKKKASHLFQKIKVKLNLGFGRRMIMHGSEFVFAGMGAADQESVIWFGPNEKIEMSHSTLGAQHKTFHESKQASPANLLH